MPLDPDVIRLATAPTLATVVTLMPDGQPQASLTWIDTDGEHVLINTEPQRQKGRGQVVAVTGGEVARAHIDELSRRYTGHPFVPVVGPQGRVIYAVAPLKVNTPRTVPS